MIFLGNPCSEPAVTVAMLDRRIGLIETPKQGNDTTALRDAGVIWCADNGAFGKGFPGEDAWFSWLRGRAEHADTCLFAVAPDVVGDAAATLERSLPWLPRIRTLGYKAAFVGQNGAALASVPWGELDVLFLGGSLECLSCAYVWPSDRKPERRQKCPHCQRLMTEWKLGAVARALAREAKARGKWLHMGRVSSQKRYAYARAIGCDSCDGTYLTFGPRVNLPDVLAWSRLAGQDALDIEVLA